MAHLDAILNILESHDPVPQLGGWGIGSDGLPRREEVFEDLHDALAEGCGEVFKDQVRVSFTDGAACGGGDVMPEEDIVKREGGGWAMGEVGDCEGGRGAAVFVQNHQV